MEKLNLRKWKNGIQGCIHGAMMRRTIVFSFVVLFVIAGCRRPEFEQDFPKASETELFLKVAGDFTIAILPDPQYYTSQQNGGTIAMFNAQTNWILANRTTENIAYVACMGDVSDHGDTYSVEWTRARSATDVLHNNNIPYGMAVGNHDQSPNTGHPLSCSTSSFNANYGVSRMTGKSWYRGHYGGNNDSHYDTFSAGGYDWIVIYIEFDSWNDDGTNVNQWAYDLLVQYSHRKAIVVSHQMIDNSGAWSYTGSGGYYQGKAIYDKLKTRSNLVMMLCGHVAGWAHRTDIYTTAGNKYRVTTILNDYQSYSSSGSGLGYMRLLKISTANNQMSMRTYSPYLDSWLTGDHEFTAPLFGTSPVKSDVTGDRKADFVTLNTSGTAYVYPGASSGVFSSGVPSFNNTMNPALFDHLGYMVIDVADVNGDGRSDLVTAKYEDKNAWVYPGQANGTFTTGVSTFNGTFDLGTDGTTGFWPLAVADVNGDGYGDLVSEKDDGTVYVYKGKSNLTFGGGMVSSFNGTYNSAMKDGDGFYAIDVADVTGDGLADLVSAKTTDNTIYLWPGTRTGAFTSSVASFNGTIDLAIVDGSGYEPVGLGDVNGDNKADLVMAHSNGNVYVYLGTNTGVFEAGLLNFAGSMPSSLFSLNQAGYEIIGVSDVTGDGKADLMAANSDGNLYVYPGQSTGYFGLGVSNFNGTLTTTRFNRTGHEAVFEKSIMRRRGCTSSGCF